MMTWRVVLAGALALGAACRSRPPADDAGGGTGGAPADQEPPVALNGDSPIQYPPRSYDQKVEGDVVLRLFVDSLGRMFRSRAGWPNRAAIRPLIRRR